MYAIKVKDKGRKGLGRAYWVKDRDTDLYVAKKDRGLWATRSDAQKHLADGCEEVVYVDDEK